MLASYPDLQGKTVLVTGGSRGIGAHTARAFAAQGAQVCAVGRDQAALDGVVADITAAGGTAIAVAADVTDSTALGHLREQTEARLGRVDVLAAFAGGQGAPVPTPELTEQRWRQVLDSELTSAFLTIQTFLPGMLDRGSGSILTMSSAAGRQPSQANLAYGVANAGLVMLTRQLATEIGPRGVRINTLAPSSIRTEKVEARMPPAVQEQIAALHPLRRLGTVDDVAQVALFLASDAACWLTGLTIDVSGGRITG
jgi:NAD(P)-dependent dehydrogenase (short-subunit alcohol dehydrogenase family)